MDETKVSPPLHGGEIQFKISQDQCAATSKSLMDIFSLTIWIASKWTPKKMGRWKLVTNEINPPNLTGTKPFSLLIVGLMFYHRSLVLISNRKVCCHSWCAMVNDKLYNVFMQFCGDWWRFTHVFHFNMQFPVLRNQVWMHGKPTFRNQRLDWISKDKIDDGNSGF